MKCSQNMRCRQDEEVSFEVVKRNPVRTFIYRTPNKTVYYQNRSLENASQKIGPHFRANPEN